GAIAGGTITANTADLTSGSNGTGLVGTPVTTAVSQLSSITIGSSFVSNTGAVTLTGTNSAGSSSTYSLVNNGNIVSGSISGGTIELDATSGSVGSTSPIGVSNGGGNVSLSAASTSGSVRVSNTLGTVSLDTNDSLANGASTTYQLTSTGGVTVNTAVTASGGVTIQNGGTSSISIGGSGALTSLNGG